MHVFIFITYKHIDYYGEHCVCMEQASSRLAYEVPPLLIQRTYRGKKDKVIK